MQKSKKIYLSGFLFLVLIVCLKTVEACSCGAAPNVLDSFNAAGNVVIVKAVAVQKADGESYGESGSGNSIRQVKSTTMSVEKVYKGNLRPGDQMIFAQGGGADCIWTFDEKSVGRRYLFYLDKGDKNKQIWIGFGCGRSGSVEGSAEDLLYLDKLDKVRGKTRISGTLDFAVYSSLPDKPVIADRSIIISGNGKTYHLKTDKNGVYEIYDLPAGTYRIIPENPRGWKIDKYYLNYERDLIGKESVDDDKNPLNDYAVILKDKKHASLSFRFEIDNALRGKVYDPKGLPMKGVCIRLYPPAGITSDFMYKADCTEQDGSFEIREVPPGGYLLVANDEGKITGSEPFKTLYYPGVFELEKAAVINIGLGDSREELNFQVPQVEETLTVEGVFQYSDGKPVKGESVIFLSQKDQSKYDGDARTATDSQGRFKLRILKGMKGRLRGSMTTYTGEYENCPKLESLIKAKGETLYNAASQEIEITAEDNVFDLQLKFPFPGCRKSKD